jgi:Prenyltransferase and squalene oxidase repeat
VRSLAVAAVAVALAATPLSYLESRQTSDGGFAEAGRRPTPGLTAWAMLGLRAWGRPVDRAWTYLDVHQRDLGSPTDVALAVLAQASTGRVSEPLFSRLAALQREDGRIGPAINSTAWGLLALAQAGRPLPRRSVRYLLGHQSGSGGWAWVAGAAPDSNDTAAVLQALRAARVQGRPIRRGLLFLRDLQNRDGGYELTNGRGSDAQSTAWVVQAFLAAGHKPGRGAFRYLAGLRRNDGSYRYSARYTPTPVWVTAQVLPALAGKPFPLR